MPGTDQIKAFLTLGFKMAGVIAALSDGFQLLKDVGPIVDAAKAIPGGLAAAPAALTQYLMMTDQEAAPLEDWIVATFDIPNDTVEQGIEAALKVVIELHGLVRLLAPKA